MNCTGFFIYDLVISPHQCKNDIYGFKKKKLFDLKSQFFCCRQSTATSIQSILLISRFFPLHGFSLYLTFSPYSYDTWCVPLFPCAENKNLIGLPSVIFLRVFCLCIYFFFYLTFITFIVVLLAGLGLGCKCCRLCGSWFWFKGEKRLHHFLLKKIQVFQLTTPTMNLRHKSPPRFYFLYFKKNTLMNPLNQSVFVFLYQDWANMVSRSFLYSVVFVWAHTWI